MSEKFGEHRPEPHRKMDLQPLKIERACQCTDHLMMQFSIHTDVVIDPMKALLAMIEGKEPETEKQWVPVMRVMSGYN